MPHLPAQVHNQAGFWGFTCVSIALICARDNLQSTICNLQLHEIGYNGASRPSEGVRMSEVYVSRHPLVQHKLTLLRRTVTEPKKFRELVRELSQLLLYEATLDLPLTPLEIATP